ncbi:Uncharacterized protein HZ326_6471 [Fusarium oxysporum f. sp. albedinis]|nr:Uncharacterized protein HZ326_6471 [Fusarium oxysporum f. sp. albedinis]
MFHNIPAVCGHTFKNAYVGGLWRGLSTPMYMYSTWVSSVKREPAPISPFLDSGQGSDASQGQRRLKNAGSVGVAVP